MRRIGVLLVVSLIVTNTIKSQEIGLRAGNVTGGHFAVDFVFNIGNTARFHADAAFEDGLGIDFLYDFMYNNISGEEFKWYLGVGPTVFFSTDPVIGASGEIGVEYRFAEFPMALGLDWRPTFYLINNNGFLVEGFGFNIRYIF